MSLVIFFGTIQFNIGGDIFEIMELQVIVLDGEEQKNVEVSAPSEWPQNFQDEFNKMLPEFQKWMLGDLGDDLPLSVKEFRDYLRNAGEEKMQTEVLLHMYPVLKNDLVRADIQMALDTIDSDKDNFRKIVRTFCRSVMNLSEVPLFLAMQTCEFGSENAEKVGLKYGLMCDDYEKMIAERGELQNLDISKGRGSKSGERASELQEAKFALEQSMRAKAREMEEYLEKQEGLPIVYSVLIEKYREAFVDGPYRREAIQKYLNERRKDMSEKMWMMANILKTSGDVNEIMNIISKGWDFVIGTTIRAGGQEKRNMAKDVVTEELFQLFDLEKDETEKRMESLKMGDIKDMFFLTIDQIRKESVAENRRSIEASGMAYLKFLEGKFRQVKNF